MLPQHWPLLWTETIRGQEKREFCFSFHNIGKIKQKEEIGLTMAALMLIFLAGTNIFLEEEG